MLRTDEPALDGALVSPMNIPSPPSRRIPGYDLARASAVLGMVVVNYTSMLEISRFSPAWLEPAVDFIYGRAAVVFVMLAGVSVSLMAIRRSLPSDLRMLRNRLFRRSLLLLLAGLALWPWWAADILHFHAVFIAVGAQAVTWRKEQLIRRTAVVMLISLPVCAALTATYDLNDVLFPGGSVYNAVLLLLDYFTSPYYSVFPWLGFFFAGMLIGRREPADASFWRRACLMGVLGCLGLELLSGAAVAWAGRRGWELEGLWWGAFLRSEAFPATPLFVLSSAFSAMAVIGFCRAIPFDAQRSWPGLNTLTACGRLSLSLYVAHIGWGILFKKWAADPEIDADSGEMFIAIAGFGIFSMLFAFIWFRHFQRGPLETLFNWFSHGPRPALKKMNPNAA